MGPTWVLSAPDGPHEPWEVLLFLSSPLRSVPAVTSGNHPKYHPIKEESVCYIMLLLSLVITRSCKTLKRKCRHYEKYCHLWLHWWLSKRQFPIILLVMTNSTSYGHKIVCVIAENKTFGFCSHDSVKKILRCVSAISWFLKAKFDKNVPPTTLLIKCLQ